MCFAGFLRKYTSNKKAPVNKVVMMNTLIETVGEQAATEAMEKMYGNRESTECTALRRTYNSKDKKKAKVVSAD